MRAKFTPCRCRFVQRMRCLLLLMLLFRLRLVTQVMTRKLRLNAPLKSWTVMQVEFSMVLLIPMKLTRLFVNLARIFLLFAMRLARVPSRCRRRLRKVLLFLRCRRVCVSTRSRISCRRIYVVLHLLVVACLRDRWTPPVSDRVAERLVLV